MEWAEAPPEAVDGMTAEARRSNCRARQDYYKRVDKQMASEIAVARNDGATVA